MVVNCVVRECFSYGTDENIRFYCIPAVHKRTDEKSRKLMVLRRSRWARALMLVRDPPPYYRICSRHFVSGKPAVLADVHNIDWIPNLHMPNAHSPLQHQEDEPSWKDSIIVSFESPQSWTENARENVLLNFVIAGGSGGHLSTNFSDRAPVFNQHDNMAKR